MSKSPETTVAEPSFEQALANLEKIVERLEDGEAGLETSLAQYERGVTLLKQCYGLLQRAERRIELLTKVDANGNHVVEPFDDSPTAVKDSSAHSAPKPGGRSQRRPKAATSLPQETAPVDESGMDESPGLF